MDEANLAATLREAFFDLCAEREGGGAGLVLQDVCDRTEVSRATACRGSPSFKTEHDRKIGAMRTGLSLSETEWVNMPRSNATTYRQCEILERRRNTARRVSAAIVAAAGDDRGHSRG